MTCIKCSSIVWKCCWTCLTSIVLLVRLSQNQANKRRMSFYRNAFEILNTLIFSFREIKAASNLSVPDLVLIDFTSNEEARITVWIKNWAIKDVCTWDCQKLCTKYGVSFALVWFLVLNFLQRRISRMLWGLKLHYL